jgi:hypothetical protein
VDKKEKTDSSSHTTDLQELQNESRPSSSILITRFPVSVEGRMQQGKGDSVNRHSKSSLLGEIGKCRFLDTGALLLEKKKKRNDSVRGLKIVNKFFVTVNLVLQHVKLKNCLT